MGGVIKSVNLLGQSTVHPIAEPPSIAPVISISKHDEERDAMLRRIAGLEEKLRQRDVEAGELRAAAAKAHEEGMEQGYESGLSAAHDRQSERLALLEKSLTRAKDNLAESLKSLSRLSALLAQDCIDIILGKADDRAEFISRIIETQMAKIDRAMLLSVRLSRLDFPNDGDLATLTERIGSSSFAVATGGDLPSGACVMSLRLGNISVGIDQQWPVLRSLLDDIALPERAG